MSLTGGTNIKTGSVELKRSRTVKLAQYKERDIVVHPSLLSYFKKVDDVQVVIQRPIDKTRDFLLAPLGFTEIVQVKENLLVLVSRRKKVINKHTGDITVLRKPIVFQQLTLKFSSRDDRDEWMKVIIAECDKVYLNGLIDHKLFFAGKFVEAANIEIWSWILTGDESLRKAYIAPAGSDQIELVRLVLDYVIMWIQELLGVTKLIPLHKKVFVALLSLLMQDAAARALFSLVRPNPGFLLDFKADTAAGVYAENCPTDLNQINALESCSAALSFVQCIKHRLQSNEWKQYRPYLAIIDHPAMPLCADTSVAYQEVQASPGDELVWWEKSRSRVTEFTWEMMKSATSESPYLSYHFIMMEIHDVIDDERVRRVLLLIDRVPRKQRQSLFIADGVAKRVRQHFRALVEYCKFREVWKLFYVDHARCSSFFEAVHMLIWSRLTMTESPLLRSIFLPTAVCTDVAGDGIGFSDCLSMELVASTDMEYLRSLDIHVTGAVAAAGDSDPMQVFASHHTATVYFRKLSVDRLVLWTQAVVGTNELTAADAPVFVNLLIAAAKSAVVRAVLWLILPASGAFQEGIDTAPVATNRLALCDQFLASLLNLAVPSSRLDRFLSFLYIAEHPLKGAVYSPLNQRNVSPVKSAALISSVDSYLTDLNWAEEMAWMDKYPRQAWTLSWGELVLMLNDTPYLALQILLHRLTGEGQSLHWLMLLKSLPNDIMVSRFLADVNMCAGNCMRHFGIEEVKMSAHFLAFIDSRFVVELWKSIQTNYLNSDIGFAEESQRRMLFVLEYQREFPGQSGINQSGFCKMMQLLSTATPAEVGRLTTTFRTLLPMVIWTSAALGDATWSLLSSMFRLNSSKHCDGDDMPVPAVGALHAEHMTSFKKYLDHLAQWSAAFYGCETLNEFVGGAFCELLSACLDNPVLRAVCMIVEPRRNPHRVPQLTDQGVFELTERLTDMLRSLSHLKHDQYLLHFLCELEHPGLKEEEDGTIALTECKWETESIWLWTTRRDLTIVFEQEDFPLLADPAFLLFHYVSRNFRSIGEEDVLKHVKKVQKKIPDVVQKSFLAYDNYLPCKDNVPMYKSAPVKSQHFKNMLTYALFHEMWKVVMVSLTSPSLDLGFAQAVMYATWLLVNSNSNPDLSALLLPLESDLHWKKKLKYLVAVQRHAVITVSRSEVFKLSWLYCNVCIPTEATGLPAEDIDTHNQLMGRIVKWVHNLLGGKKHRLKEADAELYMTLFAAAASDVAVRAFLVTFVPAPSVVKEFLRSSAAFLSYEQIPMDETNSTDLCAASVHFVKLLVQTFKSESWQQFRSFLSVLQHPLSSAGKVNETESSWTEEAAWMRQRLAMKSAMLTWKEFESLMTESPYVFLLVVTKGLPTPELQKAAMLKIPNKYLIDKFVAQTNESSAAAVCCVPHFIVMCLHEATSECALEVFQQRGMISDGFFEALLSEAVQDPSCPRLLQAFRILQRFVYSSKTPTISPGNGSGSVFDLDILFHINNISSVLITFLWETSQRPNFRKDEKIIGNMILIVLQLESCSANGSVANITTLASEWMRRDACFSDMFFKMVDALNFPKWFSRLCWNFNKHYGQTVESAPEPELAMCNIYEKLEVAPAATTATGSANAEAATSELAVGDIMLDPTVPLTKHKLTMSMLGYINLCLEFKPRALCEFVAGLGTGRPFFSFFLHKSESLAEQTLLSLCDIMTIKPGTELHKRIHDRYLFYDNDHLTPPAVRTLGLRTSRTATASLSLTDSEFTDMLTVAMYMHDLSKLDERFENAVISMIADQERREMVAKLLHWVLKFFVTEDIKRENSPLNTKSNERFKWQHCKTFNKVTFEDFMDCAAAATISSHLLRGAARSNSYVTLERLFEHYIRNNDPTSWKGLFQGSQTIAYFIKYVDVEDLNLAFAEFYKMNPENTCFKHHLLRVRKLLKEPIVSAQDLLQLTGSSSSFDDSNATRFFNRLYEKADAAQEDLKMAYLLTASWMKIMKRNVLCPLPPRNAQLITLLTVASWAKSLLHKNDKSMGKALIAQVGTGEGKSLIIAMMAIYFVKVLNKRVHILENNPGLLSKDVEMMKPLFAEFGIRTQHEGPGSERKPTLTWTSTEAQNRRDCRSEFCKTGITYCLRRNLERYYQDSIMAGEPSPLANTVLIVDEVDDLIVDEKPNQPYATKDSEQPLFQAACREAQVECDSVGEDQFDVGYFANGDFVRETAAEAYLTAKKMELGTDYAIVGGQYVILIDGKPFELYDPALECLKFIKHGQPPSFSSTYYVQSVPYILSQYDCITGFSGSLGSPSERAFLAQQYKAWSFDTPSFLNTCTNVHKVPPALMRDPQHPDVPAVHVYDSVDQQLEKVVEMCLRMHLKVPVLVIARSTEEAVEIESRVKAAINTSRAPTTPPTADGKSKFVQLFGQYKQGTMVLDQENWDRIVRRATTKGPEEDRFCITVTDPFGGRGHDFDVHDDEVDRLGGLAVIMTSIPASEREWRQWKGRTSRKDHKGQYAVVLCKEHSPVTAACELLVDYALRNSSTHDAVPHLYKERLIDKLLSLQDAQQLKKLDGLAADINKGRRLNRLCDLYYREYGSMNEATWPADAEEVKLRKLLSDYTVAMAQISSAFEDFQLQEFDPRLPVYEPPNMTNTAFWTAKNAVKWAILNLSEARQDQEAAESVVDTDEPQPAPPVQTYMKNPMMQPASVQPELQQAALHEFTPQQQRAAEKTEVHHHPGPSPVQAGIAKFSLDVKNANPLAQRRSSKMLSSTSELHKHVKNVDNDRAVSTNHTSNKKKVESPRRERCRRKSSEDSYNMDHQSRNKSDSEESDIIASHHGKTSEEEDIWSGIFAPHLSSSDSDNDDPSMLYTDPLPPPGPEVERNADIEGLSLSPAASTLPVPPPVVTTAKRTKTAKVAVQPRPIPTSLAPAMEEVSTSPIDLTNRQPIAQPTTNDPGTGKVIANSINGVDQGTVKIAANGTGHTQTSGIKAINMVNVIKHAAEVRTLDVLCVGDTKRLTNAMGPLKEQLYAVPPRGDALTVTVSDIAGPNAGNGVGGLQVSGAVTITKSTFTMVFEVKVDPEEYQFNMLLYGMKRLEAKWKNVTLLSTTVQFKPAAKVQLRGAYAFHNATNNNKVPAGGVVVIHSRDDPRSTEQKPYFNAITVPYTGADVKLPPGLPSDCIVTVSPDIPGYSNEYSEKFVMYNNERLNSETMRIMLSESNITGSQWRVVLTWGKQPRDLDLYCITNFYPSRIYFADKNEGGLNDPNKGNIQLDIDVRDGEGPETILFIPNPTKKYRFLVHNYSGNSVKSIADSEAKITIHRGSGRPMQFDVPVDIVVNSDNEFAKFWHVFDLINGVMVPINTVVVDDIRCETL